jgi:hypothetical protein
LGVGGNAEKVKTVGCRAQLNGMPVHDCFFFFFLLYTHQFLLMPAIPVDVSRRAKCAPKRSNGATISRDTLSFPVKLLVCAVCCFGNQMRVIITGLPSFFRSSEMLRDMESDLPDLTARSTLDADKHTQYLFTCLSNRMQKISQQWETSFQPSDSWMKTILTLP